MYLLANFTSMNVHEYSFIRSYCLGAPVRNINLNPAELSFLDAAAVQHVLRSFLVAARILSVGFVVYTCCNAVQSIRLRTYCCNAVSVYSSANKRSAYHTTSHVGVVC